MQIKRTLKHLSDAGHGWLSVSHDDIRTLGISGLITSYSYINGTRVFLEEDQDAAVFLEAAEKAGWDVTHTTQTCKADHSRIRNLPQYCHGYIDYPLENDRVVKLYDGAVYWVLGRQGNRIWVINENGYRLTAPASNPYAYLEPMPKMYFGAATKDSHGYTNF